MTQRAGGEPGRGSVTEAAAGPSVLLSLPCPEIHCKCSHLKGMEDRCPKEVVSVGEGKRKGDSSSGGWCVGTGMGCWFRRWQLVVCAVG